MTYELKDRWTIYDDTPRSLRALAILADWALNETAPNTFQKFLDLIGYSADQYGERIADDWTGGYREIGQLADALMLYADRPSDVIDWLAKFTACEAEAND